MMSGALGNLPPKGRGSNLIPPPPSPDTPPPWEGKGPPAAKIRMTVTSGFYVRSLCHDLGEKLGCGAMMAELSRTRQGQFVLDSTNCMEYDDLLKGEEAWAPKVHGALDLWNNPDAKVEEKSEPSAPVKAEEKSEPAEESKPANEGKAVQEDKPVEESKPADDAKAAEAVPEPESASAAEQAVAGEEQVI
jgi:tRNA pseudouridine55 synthase